MDLEAGLEAGLEEGLEEGLEVDFLAAIAAAAFACTASCAQPPSAVRRSGAGVKRSGARARRRQAHIVRILLLIHGDVVEDARDGVGQPACMCLPHKTGDVPVARHLRDRPLELLVSCVTVSWPHRVKCSVTCSVKSHLEYERQQPQEGNLAVGAVDEGDPLKLVAVVRHL